MIRGFLLSVFSLAIIGCTERSMEDQSSAECLDLRGDQRAEFSGKLTTQLFAGPPNYESIEGGDAEESAFILELTSRVCADDGEFITPGTKFDRVHISSSDEATLSLLRGAEGRNVTVWGDAFGAHTGHHHAPLVVLATRVNVE